MCPCSTNEMTIEMVNFIPSMYWIKDVSVGIPKSDLLGVNVALIHVAAQQFLCYNSAMAKNGS